MDLATLIGFVSAVGIILAAMVLGGGLTPFIDVPSILLVGGGTFGAVMMKFTLGQFLGAFKVAMKAFLFKSTDPEELIATIVDLANEARKGGLLALEGKEIENEFMQQGIQMMVDGHDPQVVRDTLTSEMNLAVARHESGQEIFKATGDAAPAMGMIGTLVGLVLMLGNMSDPKSIGPSMAVALLTTLYGALLANVFAIPLAGKLALRSSEERQLKSMIIDGLAGIQEGRNPRVIEELLRTYLPGGKRGGEAAEEAA